MTAGARGWQPTTLRSRRRGWCSLRRMSGQHDRPPAAPASLVEALTEREQVVLRYLASTLSNAEIAAQLYLSVNTVKTHQRMVYRKLGADGRRDAVRRAKQLRLL